MKNTKKYIYFYILILSIISIITNISLEYFNDIAKHTPLIFNELISASMIVMLFVYFKIIKKYAQEGDISHKEILNLFIVIAVIGASIHPTISSDIFYYVSYGIVQGKYNLNPYFTTIESIRSSFIEPPFYALKGIAAITPMTYGYIFTLYLKLLYIISFKNYYIMFYILKLFNIAAVGALISIIIRIKERFRKDIDNRFIYLLIGFNPLVILEYIVNGHNDILFILFVSIGMYMLIKEAYMLSGLIFICSFNIKSSAIFIIPFIYLYCAKNRVSWKIKISYLLLFALSLCPYYWFYGINKIPEGLAVYLSFVNSSFPFTLLSIIMGGKNNIFKHPGIFNGVISIFNIAWICVYTVLLLYYFIRERDNSVEKVMEFILLSFVLYLFVFSSVMFPWYIIWMVPFVLDFEYSKFIIANIVAAIFGVIYEIVEMQYFDISWTSIIIYLFIILYIIYYLYKVYIMKNSVEDMLHSFMD